MESNNVEFSNRISYVHEERCDVYVGGACNCIMKEVRAKLKEKDEALGRKTELLRQCKIAIASLDEDALGHELGQNGWFYRDELLHNLENEIKE